jgi:exopolysaccharide production protein ExoY
MEAEVLPAKLKDCTLPDRTEESEEDHLHIPVASMRYRVAKRLFDLALVLTLTPLVLPLLIVLAVLIKLTSPGPVFYRHMRLGQHGRTFRLWKLRTMWTNSDSLLARHFQEDPGAKKEWARQYKLQNDPRITPLGRILRRTSLDEVPQLLNVLRGEMSFVGPRPIIDAEASRYGGGFGIYCAAKPGLTGLWQVHGRGKVQYEMRVSFDMEYVSTWSFRRDIGLILKTIPVLWSMKGAF